MNTHLASLTLLCALAAACDPTPQPVPNKPPPADHRLEVWSTAKLQWFHDLTGVTFPSWAFGVDTLGSVPSIGLAASNQVTVKYSLTGAEVQLNPGQLLALARDPIELRETLEAVPAGDLAAFDQVVDGCELPDGVLLTTEYDVFSPTPIGRSQRTVSTDSFYPHCRSPKKPTGQASVPNAQSSIATLQTYRAGLCTQSVPMSDVLEQVLAGLDAKISVELSDTGCVDATGGGRAVSYVTHQSVRAPDTFPAGAFTVSYRFDGHVHAPVPDVHSGLTASFRWSLDRGRPVLTGAMNALSATGHKSTETAAQLGAAVTQVIPQRVGEQFDSRLATPLPKEGAGPSTCTTDESCPGSLVCLPSSIYSGKKTCQLIALGTCDLDAAALSQNASASQCDAAMKFLEPNVRQGGSAVGLTPPQVDAAWATASELGDDGRYRHVRCRRPDAASKARCEYVFDVKRMNVKPGQLDLVFFDEHAETAQSSFALYLALVNLGQPGALCSPNPSSGGEQHALARSNFKVAAQYGEVINCAVHNIP